MTAAAHTQEAIAWRDGVVAHLQKARPFSTRISEVAAKLESADDIRVVELYDVWKSEEESASTVKGFPPIGHEPFNLPPDELEASW